MKDRLKKARRELGLTQTEFANRIGSAQNTITGYESGRREPSNQVIALICREFNINEQWLRTGEGGDSNMFIHAPASAMEALAKEQNLSHGEYILIEKLLHLRPEVRQGILDYIMEVAAAVNADNSASSVVADRGLDIDAEVASYRRELEIQEEAAAGSLASGGQSATG